MEVGTSTGNWSNSRIELPTCSSSAPSPTGMSSTIYAAIRDVFVQTTSSL